MVKSQQRKEDLQKAINLYLKIYKEKKMYLKGEFDEYAGFYHVTNEPITQIFQNLNLDEDKKVLSVLASGDQVFELISKGVTDIDTFDINRLTEYYVLGFKKRAIECLNYEEYLKLMNFFYSSIEGKYSGIDRDLEKYVLDNCDSEYAKFWQDLIYSLKQEGYDASVFHFALKPNLKNTLPATYIQNEEEYKRLQSLLGKAKINFKQASVTDVSGRFNQYDFIYLSNILDYYLEMYPNNALLSARKLIEDIYKNNLTFQGELLLSDICSCFGDALYLNMPFNPTYHKYVCADGKVYCHSLRKGTNR